MASGNSLLQWAPAANNPPASAFATPDVRNALLVMDFDASTDEEMVLVGVMPQHYAGGGINVLISAMASSATSGACRWQTSIERHQRGTDDSDSDSFATANSGAMTAVSPSGTEVLTTIAHTSGAQMDSLAAGERFRLKIRRDADGTSGTDDMTGDAEITVVEIREI